MLPRPVWSDCTGGTDGSSVAEQAPHTGFSWPLENFAEHKEHAKYVTEAEAFALPPLGNMLPGSPVQLYTTSPPTVPPNLHQKRV
ncbi:hypothetical protein XELAEV_18014715mg [Xenopus laevis]|uniref:Uncharacterized protein n=1 Tax=Xenopus laevis TaxID=8355 RepID=A0A974DIZ3_XENLA|nr:hypothetical protein XELAEV_18014715mg [Xenopus laevis]